MNEREQWLADRRKGIGASEIAAVLGISPACVKEVSGFDFPYFITNDGQLWSCRSNRLLSRHSNGNYFQFSVRKDGKQKLVLAHRLVASAFLPNVHGHEEINHIDGNKQNNSAVNLEWCCREANIQHAWDTGLQAVTEQRRLHAKKLSQRFGSENGKKNRLLSPAQIRSIRSKVSCGVSQKEIANEFGVTHQTISRIKRGTRYSEVV